MLKVYLHPRCSTCQKAREFLTSHRLHWDEVDITQRPPGKRELQQVLRAYQEDIRKLFNTSGMQYRDLGLKDKLPSMRTQDAIELLSKNGMLVKRPFVVFDHAGLVGFQEKAWRTALL